MASHLFGRFLVTRTRPAIVEAGMLFPRACDYFELREHTLKLAYWPGSDGEGEPVVDIDWSWIQGLRGRRVGELRIADQIGGHRNLRAIFYVAPTVLPDDPLSRIWILSVMAKKRQGFSSADRTTFDCRRSLVVERFYSDAPLTPVKYGRGKSKKKPITRNRSRRE